MSSNGLKRTRPGTAKKKVQPVLAGDETEQECITYCEQFYDYEECRTVCLSVSSQNKSLFRRALLQAEGDGLNEQHQHIFAAGAVWAWAESRKNRSLS